MEERPVTLGLDVTFEALGPAVGSDGGGGGSRQSGAAASTTGKGHLEQAGRWSGALVVDGVPVPWTEARGNRDRSWGPRRWGDPSMWRWFSINIGDDLHFGGIRLGTDAGDLHRGWVSDGGRVASVRHWGLSTELADDGTHPPHRSTSRSPTRPTASTGSPVGCSGSPTSAGPGGTVINEGLTEWTHHGEDGTARVGHGVAEYLHQVDETGRPRVPVE